MDLRDTLRNPWGILHGGVTAALIDAVPNTRPAAGSPPTSSCTTSHRTASAPSARTASILGHRSDGAVLRVEVRDTGADRVAAVAVVTVASSSYDQ